MPPTILAVIESVAARLESVRPFVHPEIPFQRAAPTEDEESTERRFRVAFSSLGEVQSGGVILEGMADRVARLDLRVSYPITAGEDVDLQLAADAELIQRAFRQGWQASPIRRTQVTSTREAAPERLATVRHTVEILYRDVQ